MTHKEKHPQLTPYSIQNDWMLSPYLESGKNSYSDYFYSTFVKIYKQIAFIYPSNKQLKNKSKKIILFTVASNWAK